MQPHIKQHMMHFIIMAVALVLTGSLAVSYLTSESIWPDEALYAWQARRLVTDPGFLFSAELYQYHPPLFPFLLMPGVLASADLVGFRVITNLISLLGLAVIYFLGRRVHGPFLGVLCFLGLAFNYIYLSQAGRILTDNALSVFLMIFMWAWLAYRESGRRGFKVVLAAAAAGIILLKSSGLLIIPFFILLAVGDGRGKNVRDHLRRVSDVIAAVFIIGGLTLGWRCLISGGGFYDLSAVRGLHHIEPWWYFVVHLHNLFNPKWFFGFFIAGFMSVLIRRRGPGRAILLWLVFMLTAVSLVPEKNLRYAGLFLPAIIVLAGQGVCFILDKIFRSGRKKTTAKILILLSTLIILSADFAVSARYTARRYSTFIGFPEAGAWINKNTGRDLLFFSGSRRIMRFFCWERLRESGVDLIEIPKTRSAFESRLNAHSGPCLVEIDFWEHIHKDRWLLNIEPSPTDYLEGLGFRLSKVVIRRFSQSNGVTAARPVIWLFHRPAAE